VYESAKFYALVNWGLANAGFVGWKAKYAVRQLYISSMLRKLKISMFSTIPGGL
jgi:hypothetical protein